MVDINREVSGKLPDSLVRSIVRLAERNAEAVAAFLDMSGSCPLQADGTRLRLPGKFLLELAAVIRLGVWEQEGFRVHIEQGLPSFEQAVANLLHRSQHDPLAFSGPGNSELHRQMLDIYWRYFAWEADLILGRTVAIQIGDEDELAAALAAFLWENRERLCVFGEKQPS